MRDLVAGWPVRDLDVAVEGDAVALAREWAGRVDGRVEKDSVFGTARVAWPAGELRLAADFAATRRERYVRAGALPETSPAGIAEDLARRDFTVNAMAYRLHPPGGDRLLDPFGGRRDLARRTLRVLHPASMRDDPTRALRALRLSLRFGLRLARQTRASLDVALREGAADGVSGDRLWREVAAALAEAPARRVAALMADLGLAAAICPFLTPSPAARRRLARWDAVAPSLVPAEERAASALGVWLADRTAEERALVLARLALRGSAAAEIQQVPARVSEAAAMNRAPEEDLALLLRRWPAARAAAAAAVLAPRAGQRVLKAWQQARRVRLAIGGEDLVAAGVAPGPAVARGLSAAWKTAYAGRRGRAAQLSAAREAAR